jgi:hypothetical protein
LPQSCHRQIRLTENAQNTQKLIVPAKNANLREISSFPAIYFPRQTRKINCGKDSIAQRIKSFLAFFSRLSRRSLLAKGDVSRVNSFLRFFHDFGGQVAGNIFSHQTFKNFPDCF